MEFCIDRLNCDLVEGWAFALEGIKQIEVYVDGVRIGLATTDLARPDVAAARPELPAERASRCGFLFPFSEGHFQHGKAKVKLHILPCNEPAVETPEIEVVSLDARRVTELPANPAPFPLAVMSVLSALRGPSFYEQPWTDDRIAEALRDLDFLVRRGSKRLQGIYPYLGYLKTLWAKFSFIRDHFPRMAKSDASAKDAFAAANSIQEMITIAHHLYVLRESGLTGSLAEFGCFKGFSTALLSSACFELGIQMDVFDSFAGLPPSESTYYKAGEFRGSFEEVKRNVTEFGHIGCITFHRGFFSETLPHSTVTPLCIWMDVDLATSSRDVMCVLDRLPMRGCVFSHECLRDNFAGGAIQPRPHHHSGADDVIPPILDAFRRTGRSITGRFLFGNTGAFWDKNVSFPVLPTDAVIRLLHLA